MPSSFLGIVFSCSCRVLTNFPGSDTFVLMGVEPLPDIRDGILVERLVKTVRYVADMRRCQHVVQRPERVIRGQWLNVKYVDRRVSDSLVLQRADQGLLFDNRPARRIDQSGRWL